MQAENVQKLDLLSNEIMCNMLKSSGKTSLLISEENEEAIFIEDEASKGSYCVVFDPLDGSSNIVRASGFFYCIVVVFFFCFTILVLFSRIAVFLSELFSAFIMSKTLMINHRLKMC